MLIEQPKRASRVGFKHPVRIVTKGEPKRVIRTLTANVSRDGLFLRMPEPLPKGTQLEVALEAAGQPHALAEGEVCWGTTNGEIAGCGVRFTKYSHPRAKELLAHLVDSLEHNRPLRVAGRPTKWRRVLLVAVALLSVAGAALVLSREDAPASAVATTVAPVVVAAPSAVVAPVAEIAAPEVVVVDAAPMPAAPPKPVLTSARAVKKLEPSPALEAAMKGAPAPVVVTRSSFGSSMSLAGSARGSVALPPGGTLSWQVASSTVRLSADRKVTKAFFLASPPRAVIDLEGGQPLSTQTLELSAPHSKSLRIGKHAGGMRLVVDLERAPRDAKQDGSTLVLTF